MEQTAFLDLIERVRQNDQEAAAELVRQYEPAIRIAVRTRLTAPQLRRSFDSLDVCQSVWAKFFAHATAGSFDLERPEQLLKLLTTMARNRLINRTAEQKAARRDCMRTKAGALPYGEVADDRPGPSRVVASRELLETLLARLSEDERRLADLRGQGRPWADIAAEAGGKPDALRMQLTRAVERACRGLDRE